MRYHLIITKTGKPLANEAGTVLLFHSETQARKWMMVGESVAIAAAELVGETAIEDDVPRGE